MALDELDHIDRSTLDVARPASGQVSSASLPGDASEAPVRLRAPVPPLRPPAEGRVTELSPSQKDQHNASIPPDEDESRPRFLRRYPFGSLIGALVASTALLGGYLCWDNASHFETTDDAFIAARQFAIAPEVSGYITSVPVTDNQDVPSGGVIARIDDREYQIALEQAQAQVAVAQSNIENIDAQMAVQQAQVAQNVAQVAQAQASLTFAQQQAARYEILARDGWGTMQDAQQYGSQLRQQQATLKSAQAAVMAAARQLAALKAQRAADQADLKQAEAQRDQARLNLSYTIVTAAQPGHVVQLSASVGEYVQAGTDLTMFVPDKIWVAANFKETQLDALRPEQNATIRIDAYPEHTFHGHVASVQRGSGTAFSLLPAEDATGNWVKIVQRVPVKIIIDNPPTDVALGPGMSVDATVRVNPKPSLYERLRSWL